MSKSNARTVSRAEFMTSIEVKDIKSVVNAEFELCKVCHKRAGCERHECQEIKYAVTSERSK